MEQAETEKQPRERGKREAKRPLLTLKQFCDTLYVDSGAFYSVFKAGFAPALGLDWQQGTRIYVQVGDGGFIPVYLHTVDIQLRQYRFSGRVGFSEHLGVSFNVIGRIPFFERCIVCFDDRQGLVRLEPYNLS